MYEMESPSLVYRIAVGKAVGLVIGIIAALGLPAFVEIDTFTRVGILLWYPTMGAFIGVFGVMTVHPMFHLPLHWWVRAPLIGAWMNLVLAFFAYDVMAGVLKGLTGVALSPFWFVLEGAVVGGLIGFLATRLAGEGPETLTSDVTNSDARVEQQQEPR